MVIEKWQVTVENYLKAKISVAFVIFIEFAHRYKLCSRRWFIFLAMKFSDNLTINIEGSND